MMKVLDNHFFLQTCVQLCFGCLFCRGLQERTVMQQRFSLSDE